MKALSEIKKEDYITVLDNPAITAEMAFDYHSKKRSLESIQDEVDSLSEKNGFVPLLQTLEGRLEEIFFFLLAENIKEVSNLETDDIFLRLKNYYSLWFKLGLPQHRLNSDNQKELDICINFLNSGSLSGFIETVIGYGVPNVRDRSYIEKVMVFARTICWTGSNVGSFYINP